MTTSCIRIAKLWQTHSIWTSRGFGTQGFAMTLSTSTAIYLPSTYHPPTIHLPSTYLVLSISHLRWLSSQRIRASGLMASADLWQKSFQLEPVSAVRKHRNLTSVSDGWEVSTTFNNQKSAWLCPEVFANHFTRDNHLTLSMQRPPTAPAAPCCAPGSLPLVSGSYLRLKKIQEAISTQNMSRIHQKIIQISTLDIGWNMLKLPT